MGGVPVDGISKFDNSSEATPKERASTLKNEFNQKSGAVTKPVEYNAEAYKERHSRKWDKMEKAVEDGNELKAARKYDQILRKEAKAYIKSDEAKARPDYDEIKDGFTKIKENPSRQIEQHNVNRMVLASYRDDDYDGKSIDQRERMVERRIQMGLGSHHSKNGDYDAGVARDIGTLDKLKIDDNQKGRDVIATVRALKEFRPVQTEEQMQGDGEYVRGIVEENYNAKQHAVVIPGNEDGSGEVFVDLGGAADDPDYLEHQIEVNPEVSNSPNLFVASEAFENKKFLDVDKETGEVSYKAAEAYFHRKSEDGSGVDAGYETTEEFKAEMHRVQRSANGTPLVEAVSTVSTAGVSLPDAELPSAELPVAPPPGSGGP